MVVVAATCTPTCSRNWVELEVVLRRLQPPQGSGYSVTPSPGHSNPTWGAWTLLLGGARLGPHPCVSWHHAPDADVVKISRTQTLFPELLSGSEGQTRRNHSFLTPLLSDTPEIHQEGSGGPLPTHSTGMSPATRESRRTLGGKGPGSLCHLTLPAPSSGQDPPPERGAAASLSLAAPDELGGVANPSLSLPLRLNPSYSGGREAALGPGEAACRPVT